MSLLNENGFSGNLDIGDALPDLSDGSDSGLDCKFTYYKRLIQQ